MSSLNLAAANASAARARVTRAEWLASLHEGITTVTDLITFACQPDGRPLLRLGLVRLLSEQDGWTRTAALNAINRAQRLLGKPELSRAAATKLTVQWLVDARSGGRRVLALTDAMDRKSSQPWPGFPFAPQQQNHGGTR